MQVTYESYRSWNWKANTEFGAQLFKGDKKNFAVSYIKQLRSIIYDQSDLPDVKDELMGNMQLWLYNCEWGLCNTMFRQYYIPYCPGSIRFHSNNAPTTLDQCSSTKKCMCINGSWSWKVNDQLRDKEGNLVNYHTTYVSNVRSDTQWRCP